MLQIILAYGERNDIIGLISSFPQHAKSVDRLLIKDNNTNWQKCLFCMIEYKFASLSKGNTAPSIKN